MSNKQLNMVFALKGGLITSIEDVESGLKCNCICPACGEKLIAKRGASMMHHFAHCSGRVCEYGFESSLHLMAKKILSEAKKFSLPPVDFSFPNSSKVSENISPAKEIQIERVELEERIGNIVPDIVVYAGGKQLLIEIFVTHRIDDEKLAKIKNLGLSVIEIDLSSTQSSITESSLKELLLNDHISKSWIFNALADKYLQAFYQISDEHKLIQRGFATHVDHCPINSRVWHGKPYANFIDDCSSCQYCIFYDENIILCSGRQKVSTISDLKALLKSRLNK